VPVPNLVKAKLLLGWMTQYEAVRVLNTCQFEKSLSDRNAIALWKGYRQKVLALSPRTHPLERLSFSEAEQKAVQAHELRIRQGPSAKFLMEVIKAHPANLVAKQLVVVTDQCERYASHIPNEQSRINAFLGIGLEFRGKLSPRQVSRNCLEVDLPHLEFLPRITPAGVDFKERDRYVLAVPAPNGRLVLWGGYHRTHSVLCQLAGDAAAVAPLLTVMRGIPEVDTFFSRSSDLRDAILGERPPLLRDFLDDELFMSVNLQKIRAVGRVEQIKPGKFRAGILSVNDYS
jgi:hypothetical protein